MRIVLQRVNHARVSVKNETVHTILSGYVLLIGFTSGDTKATVEKTANKMLSLRIWSDADDKMNIALDKTKQEILAISQFTLYGDVKKGKRPSFKDALAANEAEYLYQYFCTYCRELGYRVKCGIFGENMQVALENDGPVTLIIDSKTL